MDINSGEGHVREEARDWRKRACILQDRADRFEAALREIRDYPEGEDGRLDSMEAIAREALGESDD